MEPFSIVNPNFHMMKELPYIALRVPKLIEATRSNVVNYQPHYQDRIYLHHVDLK